MKFPLYRKYSNNKSYFKVFSNDKFEEIQFIGKHCYIETFEVKILPDRNFISDLIVNYGGHWLSIDEKEYNEQLNYCKHLKFKK